MFILFERPHPYATNEFDTNSLKPHTQILFAIPLPKHPIKLFIGVLSASNHFAERMAVRKTWMQSAAIKSSDVVARFFVALVRFQM